MELVQSTTGYTPLAPNLDGFWERSFENLPETLKPLAKQAIGEQRWGSLDATNRHILTKGYDYQHDPNQEPSMYYEITLYQAETREKIKIAHDKKNYPEEAILRGVDDRLEAILETDRERLGTKIQKLMASCTDDKPSTNGRGSTYLNIIGALLECLLGDLPGTSQHPDFDSQAALISFMVDKYTGINGLSRRNLETYFPAAKKNLNTM